MPPDNTIIVEDIINEGKLDLQAWPSLLEKLLLRLDDVAANSFPQVVNTVRQRRYVTPDRDTSNSPKESQLVEFREVSNNETENNSAIAHQQASDEAVNQSSPEVMDMIKEIKQTMSSSFATAPPHTVQRLVELLHHPNDQYRSLIKYLRALQRVLSVSSTMRQSPLDDEAEAPGTGMFPRTGGDDALGGALLSPIPWLKPDQDDDIQTRVNGSSQDSLLHHDYSQRHDSNHFNAHTPNGGHTEEFSHVHAQGPPTLGPEDVGPQPSGTILPALTETTEALEAIEAQTQARQDEMTDVAMFGDGENTNDSGLSEILDGNGDSMDLDHQINSSDINAGNVDITANSTDRT